MIPNRRSQRLIVIDRHVSIIPPSGGIVHPAGDTKRFPRDLNPQPPPELGGAQPLGLESKAIPAGFELARPASAAGALPLSLGDSSVFPTGFEPAHPIPRPELYP